MPAARLASNAARTFVSSPTSAGDAEFQSRVGHGSCAATGATAPRVDASSNVGKAYLKRTNTSFVLRSWRTAWSRARAEQASKGSR